MALLAEALQRMGRMSRASGSRQKQGVLLGLKRPKSYWRFGDEPLVLAHVRPQWRSRRHNVPQCNVRLTYCKRRTRGKRPKVLSKVIISLAPDTKEISEIR